VVATGPGLGVLALLTGPGLGVLALLTGPATTDASLRDTVGSRSVCLTW
jgi:hypothetical protein